MMMLVRLIIKVILCLLVFVVAYFPLFLIDDLNGHPYVRAILPTAVVVMLIFIPFIARMKLGKGEGPR